MRKLISETQTGTIQFSDGTLVKWEFVEHVPYDPASYQNDEGIIVFVPSCPGDAERGNEYYISFSDALVWHLPDNPPIVSTMIEDAFCPEVKNDIDNFIAMMGS